MNHLKIRWEICSCGNHQCSSHQCSSRKFHYCPLCLKKKQFLSHRETKQVHNRGQGYSSDLLRYFHQHPWHRYFRFRLCMMLVDTKNKEILYEMGQTAQDEKDYNLAERVYSLLTELDPKVESVC